MGPCSSYHVSSGYAGMVLVSKEEANVRKFLCSLESFLFLLNFHWNPYGVCGCMGWVETAHKGSEGVTGEKWKSLTV